MELAYVESRMQASDLPSLLDDAGFQAELERFERSTLAIEERPITDAQLDAIAEIVPRRSGNSPSAFDEQAQRRAHAALERALEPEFHEQQQHHHHAHARSARVPRAVVALVAALGFLAGAGAAGAMFRDRVAQIVVERIHLK